MIRLRTQHRNISLTVTDQGAILVNGQRFGWAEPNSVLWLAALIDTEELARPCIQAQTRERAT